MTSIMFLAFWSNCGQKTKIVGDVDISFPSKSKQTHDFAFFVKNLTKQLTTSSIMQVLES